MEEEEDLSLYIKKMDQLLMELDKIGSPIRDENAALFLLISLPPTYEALKTALKVSNKMLTLEQVKTALHSEEAKRNRRKSSGSGGASGGESISQCLESTQATQQHSPLPMESLKSW